MVLALNCKETVFLMRGNYWPREKDLSQRRKLLERKLLVSELQSNSRREQNLDSLSLFCSLACES